MTFSQTCTIAASRQAVWDFLLDVENVGRCLPGVAGIRAVDNETYEGTLKVKVGPIALTLEGRLQVEARDPGRWHGSMRADAKDLRLGGGVRARLSMDLVDRGSDCTEMNVTLEAHVMGRIGEFGQPVMRKKADAMLQEFARQVSLQLGQGRS